MSVKKIDLTYVFVDLNGEPITEKKQTGETNQGPVFETITAKMKLIATNALLNTGDPQLSGSDKAKRYALALRINDAEKEIELGNDDLKLLKGLIGQFGSPLIVGQAWEQLEK